MELVELDVLKDAIVELLGNGSRINMHMFNDLSEMKTS